MVGGSQGELDKQGLLTSVGDLEQGGVSVEHTLDALREQGQGCGDADTTLLSLQHSFHKQLKASSKTSCYSIIFYLKIDSI